MNAKRLLASLAAASLLASGASTLALAQIQAIAPGTVYSLNTAASGNCPALDWHLVVGEGGSLSGMIAWDNMKSMAHAEGKFSQGTHDFTLTAKEVAGPKIGTVAHITGTASNDGWLIANITAPGVNCPNVKVPIWNRLGTQK